jgi:hypothetical protein
VSVSDIRRRRRSEVAGGAGVARRGTFRKRKKAFERKG